MTIALYNMSYITGNNVDFINILKGVDATMFSISGIGIIVNCTRTASLYQNINYKYRLGITDSNATQLIHLENFIFQITPIFLMKLQSRVLGLPYIGNPK